MSPSDLSASAGSSRRKVSTGYGRLDKILQGGFLEGSSIVLICPAGDEVPRILRNFLQVSQDGNGLLICRSLSSAQAIAPLATSNLKFLICGEQAQPDALHKILQSKGLDNLTELNLDVSEAVKSTGPERVAIYILSDILLKHKVLLARKWLIEILSKLHSRQITTLAIINPDLHTREEVEALAELFDGNLEILETDVEGMRRKILRVKWMHGIEVAEKEFPLDLIPERPAPQPLKPQPSHNLPLELTSLIGREKELADAQSLLLRDDVRLVTLTGPGGTGKTRLGLELARELIGQFGDGVFLVSLAQINDPSLLSSAIAQTLGIMEKGGKSLLDSLIDYLRDKQTLLFLDNFEQLTTAGPQVAQLLHSCPRLKILVTSRQALHVRGEFEFFVPSLPLPDLKRLPSAEALSQNAAVSLFVQRALAVRSDFAINNENFRTVAEICVRLDGLPLALELAAARVKLLSPQEILTRLERSLTVLTGGPQDLPMRQQTLRGAIAWSYDLLNETERVLFRKLSVFVGGCTIEYADAVFSGTQELGVLDGLSSLVDKSMLRREERDGETRFVMLETIREFALDAVVVSGEEAEVRRRHANQFLALAEQAEPELLGPRQAEWLERLEREHGNLRAALEWSVKRGDAILALHLSAALWRFWYTRGHLTEGRGWLLQVLASSFEESAVRAQVLNGAGVLAQTQGDSAAASTHYEESLAIFRKLADKPGIAACLNNLGLIANDQGDYARAKALYEESLAISRELGNKSATAHLLNNLALMAQRRGDYPEARSLFEESLVIKRPLGDECGIAASLLNLGNVSRDEGDRKSVV